MHLKTTSAVYEALAKHAVVFVLISDIGDKPPSWRVLLKHTQTAFSYDLTTKKMA